jgi:ABC-type dipeptide/oligopeptide/nickel transport system ATPase component
MKIGDNMFGRIISIEGNMVHVEITPEASTSKNFINSYVAIEEPGHITIGEVTDIIKGIAYVNILGEIQSSRFVFGVVRKPSFAGKTRLVPKELVSKIISIDDFQEEKDLHLGTSTIYEGINIDVNINQFFSNHFAIFGSTGSGKSSSVARIFQNLFEKQGNSAKNATIFIFDAYGEYHSAFRNINEKNPDIHFKSYTTALEFADSEILKIPLWLLSVDDIALLLGAEKHSQIPIIEKAMKLVTIFGRDEDMVIKHKNDIISRAILDILSSGRPSAQIRDQVFSVLSYYNTKELSLDSLIFQPGYTRPVKQCLLIDASGKIRDMELLTNYFEKHLTDDLELHLPDGSFKYTLKDLKDAFDFALISEGALKSEKVYDEANILKVRMHGLVNSDYSKFFEVEEFVTKERFISDLMIGYGGKAQIINFNINYIDDRFAKTIVKIYSKLIFDYSRSLEDRASIPIHIILEEAHRYVQNDNDVFLLGYNIFDRITKEGRKYGVLLGLISQRPSELSETSISQCNNFLIFKMLHPKDVDYIREMVPNITNEVMNKLRILQPGTCVAFGSAFKVPIIIYFQMPDPAPTSSSANISGAWFEKKVID